MAVRVGQLSKQVLERVHSDLRVGQLSAEILQPYVIERPFRLSGSTMLFGNLDAVMSAMPPVSVVGFEPSVSHPSVVVANDGKSAFNTDGGVLNHYTAKGTFGRNTGKVYFEGRIFLASTNSSLPGNTWLGLCEEDYDPDLSTSSAHQGFILALSMSGRVRARNIFFEAMQDTTSIRLVHSHVVMRFAIDFDNGLIWACWDGMDWNGDPSADPSLGTGGFEFINDRIWVPFRRGPTSLYSASLFLHDELFCRDVPAGFSSFAGPLNDATERSLLGRYYYQSLHDVQGVPRDYVFDERLIQLYEDLQQFRGRLDYVNIFATQDQLVANFDPITCLANTIHGQVTHEPYRYQKGLGGVSNADTENYVAVGSTNLRVPNASTSNVHLGLWSLTDIAEEGEPHQTQMEFGHEFHYVGRRTPSGLVLRGQATSSQHVPEVSLLGYTVTNRDNGNTYDLYKDGALEQTISQSGRNFINRDVTLHKVHTFTNGAGVNELAIAHAGPALTAQDVEELHTLFKAYLEDVGAISPLDPSTLGDLRYHFDAGHEAYADDQGTPAEDGQGVAVWGNKGLAEDAVQTSTANRPTYRTDGVAGRPYLECDHSLQQCFGDLDFTQPSGSITLRYYTVFAVTDAIDPSVFPALLGSPATNGGKMALYVRRQGFWDNRRRELTEALVHQVCHIRPLHLDEASGAV